MLWSYALKEKRSEKINLDEKKVKVKINPRSEKTDLDEQRRLTSAGLGALPTASPLDPRLPRIQDAQLPIENICIEMIIDATFHLIDAQPAFSIKSIQRQALFHVIWIFNQWAYSLQVFH